MVQLIKKEFQLNLIYIIFLILFIPLSFVMNMPSTSLYIGTILGFIFNAFYYDSKNHVNRFTASLPFRKKYIVLGKYVFFLIVTSAFLLYVWLIDKIARFGLPYLESKPMDWFIVLLIFTSIAMMLSISIPIYYVFQSYIKAFLIQIILLFSIIFGIVIIIGNPYIQVSDKIIRFILDIIDLQPVLILIGFSLGSLYLSYRLASWIYVKKDIL
ncbi:hypothetical protein CIL05_04330 [Virgibacillus profundi]|uniref:Uncharacterized protein n=1 Tax=Virgibacillus profundi TaxID=2024555 RepID=A0A2A2IHW7_9BACI|nr:ABC-2 transporter permease [Virgibacillus profundi]PAV30948.1 hypothetical protein CIL05_04330 [Virgibacillus profundi]PXY55133.1 hypothetical protein CIT14_04415 [Virgibacillus profundi]